jgi:ribosomal protein S18 acetylase RimI-like enzyme
MHRTILADMLELHEESSNAREAIAIGGEVVERGDVMLVYSEPGAGTGLNFACRVRSGDAHIEDLVDHASAWLKQHGVPPHFRVSPLTRPSNLARILERRGFQCTERETQMVLEGDDTEPPTNPRATVGIIQAGDIKVWLSVQNRGFGATDEPAEAAIDRARASLGSDGNARYLGCLDGQPVCAGTLIHGAGVFGIYGVATLTSARKQGVATAMVRQMIRDVRARGEPICLQALTSGAEQRWYERLGFRMVYDRTGWTKQER